MHIALGSLLLLAAVSAEPEDLRVLRPDAEGTPPQVMLQLNLRRQAAEALDARRQAYEQRKTVEQWEEHCRQTRAFFVNQLGGFPERTPLHARTVGKLAGDGYRLEKVIYESRPRHYVTAVLYLPEGPPPYPAVLIACGHSNTGKAAAYNQRLGIVLARNGLAALCYDPIGQGERSQLLADGKPKYNSSTQEHFMAGVGSILLGTNTAQYRIYDGLRGIDYLTERDDIDGTRIGCTGCSGGGTLTSYIMALDERVTCAAPACYITTFEKLLSTIGPQDAEQNIFGQVEFGMDHADYLFLRAPRPTLICSTTGDYFSIEGAWDTFRQAKRMYTRLGFPERVDLVEVEGPHGIPAEGRTAMTRWMRRWLLGIDDAITESEADVWTVEQLQCTPDGQTLLLPGARSVYDLNTEREEQLAEQRREFWSQAEPDAGRETIRQLARIRPLDGLPAAEAREAGRIERQGYTIEKRALRTDPGIVLPALVLVPENPRGDAVLYLHGEGKQAEAGADGELSRLASEGHLVLAVDLRGLGETSSGERASLVGADWKTFYLAYLLGQSLVGLRAEDTLVAARYLRQHDSPTKPRTLRLIAVGEAAIPALHAAALHPELFSSVVLRNSVRSWSEVVRTPEARNQLVNTVHAALTRYDLPDLVKLAGSERVRWEDPLDAAGNPVPRPTPQPNP